MTDLARLVAPVSTRFAALDARGTVFALVSDADTETAQLWLQRAGAPPVRATAHPDPVAVAAFRPGDGDGGAVVYAVDRDGDENHQLHLLTLADGRTTPLTAAPAAFHRFGAFRPDGGALAYTTNAENGVDVDVDVHPLDGGAPRRVLRGHGLRRVEAWSPCGRYLAVVAEPAALREELQLLDLATGGLTTLLGGGRGCVVRAVRFLADGGLALVTDAGRDLPGAARLAPGDGRLEWWLAPDVEVDALAVTNDGHRLAAALNHQGFTTVEVQGVGGAAVRFVLDGVAADLAFDAAGEALFATVETPRHPPRPWRFDLAAESAAPMAGFAAPEPTGPAPAVVHVASHDGRRVPALLYRPEPAALPTPAPAVMALHGGPESQWRPGWHGEVAAMAARGWTVLAPNIRGSTGYGRHYAGLDDGPLRADAIDDVAALGRWLAGREDVDAARLALLGQSYGGFMTLAGLARAPALWRCGVAFYGMAELSTFLRDTAAYRRAHRSAEYGDRVADAALLAALSPLAHQAAIRAPVLLAHGLGDPRVPPAESRRMAAALAARAHPVEHVEIAAEGHGFTKRTNRTDVWRRALTFLEARLAR